MFQEEIDNLHAPKISLEIVLPVRREKVFQRRRSGRSLGNCSQKLRCRLRNTIIAQQRFAERGWFASGPWHLFIAGRAECVDHFINQLWIVRRVNG